MELSLETGWKGFIGDEFDKPYFQDLTHFVREEYIQSTCYPKIQDIFAAFSFCALEDLKVVILGQDPYHGPNQANGLCFSVAEGQQHPPSLKNIFKELELDLGVTYAETGNLDRWARQGVLLLNSTLTVRAHHAGSHQGKGWEVFTDAVIDRLNTELEHIVFLLWGNSAKRKAKRIDTLRHFVLHSGHPSPLSANRGLWFGNGHFSKANQFLLRVGKAPINW